MHENILMYALPIGLAVATLAIAIVAGFVARRRYSFRQQARLNVAFNRAQDLRTRGYSPLKS